MKQRIDYWEQVENEYANMGKVKRNGEQVNKGNGNGSDFRAGISKTDETILPDTQTES